MKDLKEKSETKTGEQAQTRTVLRVYSNFKEIDLSRKSGHIFSMAQPVKIDNLESITINENGKIVDYSLISERGEDWVKRATEGTVE